jgi:hypothetical protein
LALVVVTAQLFGTVAVADDGSLLVTWDDVGLGQTQRQRRQQMDAEIATVVRTSQARLAADGFTCTVAATVEQDTSVVEGPDWVRLSATVRFTLTPLLNPVAV